MNSFTLFVLAAVIVVIILIINGRPKKLRARIDSFFATMARKTEVLEAVESNEELTKQVDAIIAEKKKEDEKAENTGTKFLTPQMMKGVRALFWVGIFALIAIAIWVVIKMYLGVIPGISTVLK